MTLSVFGVGGVGAITVIVLDFVPPGHTSSSSQLPSPDPLPDESRVSSVVLLLVFAVGALVAVPRLVLWVVKLGWVGCVVLLLLVVCVGMVVPGVISSQ
jgi:hypothetical protein